MQTENTLYPIFLKLHKLPLLIVGGGNVGLEKLSLLLKNSPDADATILSQEFSEELITLCEKHNIKRIKKSYESQDLQAYKIVIAATNIYSVNQQIASDANKSGVFVNVADTPELCDFYLGAIVSKGPLKIAISTNGQSPTLAKRLRMLFEDILSDDVVKLSENLNDYRKKLSGDFQEKVRALNKITESIVK